MQDTAHHTRAIQDSLPYCTTLVSQTNTTNFIAILLPIKFNPFSH